LDNIALIFILITAKKSAFFPENDVASFAADFLEIREPSDVFRGTNLKKFTKQIKS